MEDLLKDALAQVPLYLSNFHAALVSPEIILRDNTRDPGRNFNKALMFLGISVLVTLLIRLPLVGRENATAVILASYSIWALCVLFSVTAIISSAWKILGGRLAFPQYLLANCYFFCVVMVLAHLIGLISYSAGRAVRNGAVSFIVVAVGLSLLSAWCFVAWQSLGRINHASWLRSLVALAVTAIIAAPVFLLLWFAQWELLGVSGAVLLPFHP